MLHEVLLALSGYPGSLFIEDNQGNYSVVKDAPFLHPSEICILDRLCKLITSHKLIQNFISAHGHALSLKTDLSDSSSEPNGKTGLYMRALCRGLEQVLEPYRQLILQIEKEVLSDPYLPLTYIQTSLEEYYLCFPSLVSLLKDIDRKQIRGCSLLDVIHAHQSSGLPSLQKAVKTIMHVCHSVMYRQLSAWLLYGLLMDPYKEFFILKASKPEKSGLEDVTDALEVQSISSSNSEQLDSEFYLQPDMLPVYIPVSLAEKICFVGESIQLLESKEYKNTGSHYLQQHLTIVPNREEYSQKLLSLQNEEFHFRKFESVIDEIRKCVAEQLWKLAVEDVGLVTHLKIIKDFFLLGRGELFQAFIDQAGSFLQIPVTSTTERNVNIAFQSSARSMLLEDDSLLEKFHITVRNEVKKPSQYTVEFASKVGGEIGWNNITLKYKVSWPLHIIFTETILEKYNIIFNFLLFVKRVQLELQRCWTVQMQWKNQRMEDGYPLAWKLRTLMAFVTDNLQYYLQVDVLESQYTLLVEKIQSTHDFEEIRHAHENFIISLLAQTFLSTKTIASCIIELLELSLNFCQQFSVAASLPPRLHDKGTFPLQSSTFASRVGHMQNQFSRQAGLLFQILSRSHTYQTTPFVDQLLMRLDFNKYFTNSQI